MAFVTQVCQAVVAKLLEPVLKVVAALNGEEGNRSPESAE